MDWIRRNWPDLLIGIALVAVIAGIIATLLTGGSFFPLGASQASSSRPEQSSSSIDRGSAGDLNGRSGSSETSARNQAPASTEEAAPEGADRGPITVSALPVPGTTQDAAEDEASVEEGTPVTEAAEPAAASEQTSSESGASSRTRVPDADEEGVYRISVGAFSTAENAERQAETFRSSGYPVFIGTQGDLSIVLVGPYDQLAEAERVAERIRGGGFRIEPVIYRFQVDSERAAPSSNSAGSTAATSTAPAPQPTAAEATAGRYLQVGAYATAESAQPQVRRLEGLGFRVTERVEGELVKLLVGPFANSDLGDARTLLTEQGIDHFPR